MRHLLAALSVAGLLSLGACSIPAAPYARVSGGIAGAADARHEPGVRSDTFPEGVVSAAIGTQIWPQIQAEVEFSHRQHAFGDFVINNTTAGGHGKLYAPTLMLNGIFQVPLSDWWTLNIGAGAGIARVRYKVDAFGSRFLDNHDRVFAGQLLLGASRQFDSGWSVFGGYRLLITENPVMRDTLNRRFESEYLGQSLELGVAFVF